MPATQIMYAVVRPDGYGKKTYVRVPFVSALISEPDVPMRYFVLPPEDEPPAPARTGPPKGAPKARTYRDIGPPLDE